MGKHWQGRLLVYPNASFTWCWIFENRFHMTRWDHVLSTTVEPIWDRTTCPLEPVLVSPVCQQLETLALAVLDPTVQFRSGSGWLWWGQPRRVVTKSCPSTMCGSVDDKWPRGFIYKLASRSQFIKPATSSNNHSSALCNFVNLDEISIQDKDVDVIS